MSTKAVVISLSKVDHENFSEVNCLGLIQQRNGEARPYGRPFQMTAWDGVSRIIPNDLLRLEAIDVGKIITVELESGCYRGNTGNHLDIPRIMQGIKFDDPQSAVAFRGIAEAFPFLSNAIWFQSLPAPFQRDRLVSVQELSLKDNNLEAVTLLGERISIRNRSRNDYQNSSIQEVKLPIRKPMSERDVGDLILLSLDLNEPPTWLICTGIFLNGELKHYQMDSFPRGYCLIINNMSFEDKKLNRHCAIRDEQNLRALFENDLHFQVHVFHDLQNFQMEDICSDYSKKDHSKFDAFVCIVMSHGDTGDKILGVKGRTTGIEQLMSKFKAKNCPSLAHKPKMFFIQACRGLEEDKFLTQSKGDNDYDAGLTSDSTLARCSSILPQESDFLLGFATVPGYVAYKHNNYGSFYMQALTDIIKRHHRRYHLEEMLVEVNNSVSEKCNQVPAKHGTLRGKVFL